MENMNESPVNGLRIEDLLAIWATRAAYVAGAIAGSTGGFDGVGPNAGFVAGECVRRAVKGLVFRIVVFAEGAEGVFAGPAIDGEVAQGDIGVAQELSSQIVRGGAEEPGPGALRAVGGLKCGNLLFGYIEFPDHDEHAWLRFRL